MEVETENTNLLMCRTGRDGILILDAESGCVLEVNPFLTELLGLSREELRGRGIGRLGIFEDRAQVEILFDRARKEGYAHCEDMLVLSREGVAIVDLVANSYLVDRTPVIQFNVCARG